MAEIKFGRQQFGNPTPAKINFWNGIISTAAPALSLWVNGVDNTIIGPHTSSVITSVCSLIMLVSNLLRPFFGAQISGGSVPADKVTAIETDKP